MRFSSLPWSKTLLIAALATASTLSPLHSQEMAPATDETAPAAETAAPAEDERPAAGEGGQDAAAKPKKPAKEKKPFAPEISSSNPGAAKVRLFILSGQSNMQGLKPDTSLTPALRAAFPEDDVVVVKDAQSGQPIRDWLVTWQPAEGEKAPAKAKGNGKLYERLKGSIAKAMEGKPEPTSVVFIWMQGEADAKASWSSKVYEKSLRDLITLVRTDMKAPKMPVVIGRLSDHTSPSPADWTIVRTAQEAVVEADPLVKWVDTDDLNGPKNGLHYNGPGYKLLGERFADAAIKLLKE